MRPRGGRQHQAQGGVQVSSDDSDDALYKSEDYEDDKSSFKH